MINYKLDFDVIKNYFSELIKKRFVSKHKKKNKTTLIEEDFIENFIKPSDTTRKDKFIRNILVLIDFLLEDIEFKIKFDNNQSFYSARIRKVVLGAAKGVNKHKEMHFITIFYDFEICEYLQINPDDLIYYNKFNLFSISKMYLNLKLEYGFQPDNYYTLLNTINLKSEIISGKINVSSRSLDSLFYFIVSIIFK